MGFLKKKSSKFVDHKEQHLSFLKPLVIDDKVWKDETHDVSACQNIGRKKHGRYKIPGSNMEAKYKYFS